MGRRVRDLALPRPQASLSKMGIDPTAALERARSRSRSRVGRKRTRSVAAADAMDVDGGDGAEPAAKKRVHSSKSRCVVLGNIHRPFHLRLPVFSVCKGDDWSWLRVHRSRQLARRARMQWRRIGACPQAQRCVIADDGVSNTLHGICGACCAGSAAQCRDCEGPTLQKVRAVPTAARFVGDR